jgi:hypothetical protein
MESERVCYLTRPAFERAFLLKLLMEPSLTVGLLPRPAVTGGSGRTSSLPRGSSPTGKEGFVTKRSIIERLPKDGECRLRPVCSRF